MKFLIIGASGFIGGNVLEYVRSRGFAAIGTQSRPRSGDLVTFNLVSDRIVDCVGRQFFEDGERVCVIICSVVSNMDRCLTDRANSHLINVENTIRLIEDVREFDAKIIFLSTCFAFDGTRGYYSEEDPISPVNEYARHKVEVEQFLVEQVPDAFVARLEKTVGDNPKQGQMFAQWYQLVERGEPIVCIEGSLLSPTCVGDVARGFVVACERDIAGIYHLCNSEFFYRDELARQFCYAMDRPANVVTRPLEEFNFADKRALKSYLNGSKFTGIAGLRFTPMSEVFRAFRENLNRRSESEESQPETEHRS